MKIQPIQNNIKFECYKMNDMYIELTDADILNLIDIFPDMVNNKFMVERIKIIHGIKKDVKLK